MSHGKIQWKDIIKIIHLEEVALSVFYEKGLIKLQCQTTGLLLRKYDVVSNL